ncbi:MAG: 5'-nucleotidase C-terminal domain-containing protein [Microbacter sp.]
MNFAHFLRKYTFLLVLLLFGISSCRSYRLVNVTATQIRVDQKADKIQDQRMVALLKPYADSVAKVANQVIGYSDQTMRVGYPEGLLSDFFADAMLTYVQQKYPQDSAEIAMTNVGGLRSPIYKGPVTVGKIYELMPFENAIVVLHVKGTAVQQLADSIAKYGGAVAGIRFQAVDKKRAEHVLVNGKPLLMQKVYVVVANDYIAKGNDHFDGFLHAVQSKTYAISLRRLMIDYIKQLSAEGKTIHQVLDGRIYE